MPLKKKDAKEALDGELRLDTSGPPKAEIIVKGISKSFGDKNVLNKVDLEIEKGDIFGVIGMSGAGKTTLLQVILGFLIPEKGDVFFLPEQLAEVVEGKAIYKSVFRESNEVKKTFGIATQRPSFYERLTVKENLMYFGRMYSIPKDILETNITTILELVGLKDDEDTLGINLSGGMQKRLDIACSMIHNPSILLLDEPTADLDPVLRTQMWDLIKKINSKGTTILLASHFLDEIEQLCTKIAVLHERKIIGYGSLLELKKIFAKYEEVRFKTELKKYDKLINDLKKLKGAKKVFRHGDYVIIHADDAEKMMEEVIKLIKRHKDKLFHAEISRATLGEIFEALTEEGFDLR